MIVSNMYVVDPIPFTPDKLISTTAIETTPTWVQGTQYAKNDRVVWTVPEESSIVYHIYESTISSNNVEPGTDLIQWVDIGPCNKCAMFDNRISTQTSAASPLVVVFEPKQITSNVALLNIIGANILFEVLIDNIVVYQRQDSLDASNLYQWQDYYFKPAEQKSTILYDTLPLYYNPTIRITLTGPSTVGIGHFICGMRQELGILQRGSGGSLVDYSRKVTDEFGITTFIERDYADEYQANLFIQNQQINSVKRILRKLRATPTLFVGSQEEQFSELFVAFGWARSNNITVQYPEHSILTLDIGALT